MNAVSSPNRTSSLSSILGLSAYYHDSSAALIVDGEIVAAAAEERFTRLKHDSNFPVHAVRFCLEQGGVEPSELDAVVFYEQPAMKFTRVLVSTLAGFPRSGTSFVNAMKDWLGSKLWVQGVIAKELKIDPRKVRMVPHHTSHQAQAFFTSPFEESAILTMDAVGEWSCTAIGHGIGGDQASLVTREAIPYPHSLGLAYAAFTSLLGFRPNDGEASTMALAAFGKPRFADDVRAIIRVQPNGLYTLDHRWFNFLSSGGSLFTSRFIKQFGAPRDHRNELPFSSLDDHFGSNRVTDEDQRFADIAASVQVVLEEAVLGLARRARRLTNSRRLCVAGGVALNAVANTRVIEEAGFEEVFIPPDPGDGGAAVGAALAEHCRLSAKAPVSSIKPWLGGGLDAESLEPILANADPADWSGYMIPGCRAIGRKELETEHVPDLDELCARVARDLGAGRVVGWCQGSFELGPRALGNRSILVDPGNMETVRRLSLRVKKRAAFRPYALSIREEDLRLVFDFRERIPHCARWMQMVMRVRPEIEPLVRGALHVNRTTRLQVCSREDNPRFHALLTTIGKHRGLGVVLNTSFNASGYPMIASASEALIMFANSDMDTLVVTDLMIRKAYADTKLNSSDTDRMAVGAVRNGGIHA